jgi:antitoxin (DNA-binding transcriptional repressor) of toxin-antitoxin stability system
VYLQHFIMLQFKRLPVRPFQMPPKAACAPLVDPRATGRPWKRPEGDAGSAEQTALSFAWAGKWKRVACHGFFIGQRTRGCTTGIIIDMGMVRISEADLARDLHAVLAKVQQGIEVIVEQDHRPAAVIKPSQPAGRMISEVVSDLKSRGSTAVIDDDFALDVEEGIQAHRQPWHPPSLD